VIGNRAGETDAPGVGAPLIRITLAGRERRMRARGTFPVRVVAVSCLVTGSALLICSILLFCASVHAAITMPVALFAGSFAGLPTRLAILVLSAGGMVLLFAFWICSAPDAPDGHVEPRPRGMNGDGD
jgi:hypothetical protein